VDDAVEPAWAHLAEHARSRHAVIGWHAAVDLGIPPSTIDSWCQAGRLHRPAPGVLLVAGAPPTWRQRAAVAALSGAAWASHRTASTLWGHDGFPPRQIEVVTVHGLRRKRSTWIVHESRTLRGVDLDEIDGIPCTSEVRTLLDLPAVAHPFRVAQALDHACRRRSGMLDALVHRHRELARRGRPGVRVMNDMLAERIGTGRFTDSGFEAAAVRLVRSAGLPEPALQHRLRLGDQVVYLDLAWPSICWAVECDSLAAHFGKRAHEWDRARRRLLKRLGWDVVEVTYDQVTKHGRATGTELRELYELRRRSVARSGVSQPEISG
jgi:very-short-patch-repair endonuclease